MKESGNQLLCGSGRRESEPVESDSGVLKEPHHLIGVSSRFADGDNGGAIITPRTPIVVQLYSDFRWSPRNRNTLIGVMRESRGRFAVTRERIIPSHTFGFSRALVFLPANYSGAF